MRRIQITYPLLAGLALLAGAAHAYSGGIPGYSGKTGTSCAGCHAPAGGAAPTVSLSGPASLQAGATASYTLTIQGGPGGVAGLDIAASTGSALLTAAAPGTYVSGGEVVQSSPPRFSSGQVVIPFQLTAPSAAGPITLYASGLSCNGDGTASGDAQGLATLAVSVQGGGGGDGGTSGGDGAPSAGGGDVALVQPRAGAELSGVALLLAAVASPTRPTAVEFSVDGAGVGSVSDPSVPMKLDTRSWPNGPHVLTATATLASGVKSASLPVPFTIANASNPSMVITGRGCSHGGGPDLLSLFTCMLLLLGLRTSTQKV